MNTRKCLWKHATVKEPPYFYRSGAGKPFGDWSALVSCQVGMACALLNKEKMWSEMRVNDGFTNSRSLYLYQAVTGMRLWKQCHQLPQSFLDNCVSHKTRALLKQHRVTFHYGYPLQNITRQILRHWGFPHNTIKKSYN